MSWIRVNWRWLRWALLGAAVVAFLAFRKDLPHVNLDKAIQDLSNGLGTWTYLLVGGLAFLETGAFVGLVAPGEFTVMLGGAVAQQGEISLPLIIAVTWACAFAGDSASFVLGTRLGRGFMLRNGPRFRISEERLSRVEAYFQRHGGKTILIGRFIGLVRALAPFIAGSSRMQYRAFAPFSILGTGLWSAALVMAGYLASQSLDTVTKAVGTGLLVFAIVVGIVIAIVVAYRTLSDPVRRSRLAAEMEKQPPLRPIVRVGRRWRPQLAFLGRRLTPGGLGLELTTLLAGLSVGLFVLISYWAVIAGNPDPTPGDRTAYDFVGHLHASWLEHAMKGITYVGYGWVVWSIVGVAAIVLAARRRWLELSALVIGMLMISLLTQEIKDWTQRPRPPDPLVPAHGYSFPSGHAANSTVYIWLAVTFALRIVPSITRRTLVIVTGIVLAALVGLSRVYLRVHWLSDVTSGWALGLSCFSAVAVAALVLTHIRDNPRGHDRAPRLDPGAGAGAGH